MTMHVAISGWLLGEPSGANRRLLALVEHASPLLAAGERITVLHGDRFAPEHSPASVAWRAVAIPASPAWRRASAERRSLPAILRDLGATVLDHGFLPLPRVPVATCLLVHDTRAADGLTRWPGFVARSVLRRSCLRANAVVVPSEWTAARLRSLVSANLQPIVVHNGVVVPPRSATPPSDYLLHVGHVERRKNLDVVVHALAAMPAARRPPLWLAGNDAGDAARLRSLADRLGVAANVRFLGTVSERDLGDLYAAARAVVVPSVHEGFGLSVLEALAHGRPALASDAGALPEVAGGTGILLPPHDVAAWTRAIDSLQADTEPSCDARRARAAAFDWKAAAQRLVAVWRAVHDLS